MKVYALAPNELWIVDRFVKEWNVDNADIIVHNPSEADVIWLFADWAWTHLSFDLLRSKKVVTTIHHIVPEKFQEPQRYEFKARDDITDAYHVPNEHTKMFIEPLTTKPIHTIGYWANQKIWRPTGTKKEFRQKYSIPDYPIVLGSFQRDTEGAGIERGIYLPKREKGPDLLGDFLELYRKTHDLHVVLAGWRRQYLISRLESASISYSYFERPSQETLNELYQTLDLYPITSRYEGGPQSLIECGLLNVPVVSRDVGMASMVLPPASIGDDLMTLKPHVPNVSSLMLPQGYEPFRKLFQTL